MNERGGEYHVGHWENNVINVQKLPVSEIFNVNVYFGITMMKLDII